MPSVDCVSLALLFGPSCRGSDLSASPLSWKIADGGCEGRVVKMFVRGGGIQARRDDKCDCEKPDNSGKDCTIGDVGACRSKKR